MSSNSSRDMSAERGDFLPTSQASSVRSNTALAARAISTGAISQLDELEQMKATLVEKVKIARDELKDNEAERSKLTAELKSKQKFAVDDGTRSVDEVVKQLKEAEEHLQKQIHEAEAWRYTILESFEEDAIELAKQFCYAPANFAPEKIQEDILQENSHVEEMQVFAQNELDPKISASKDLMANEPMALFEYPGSPPEELTAGDLDTLLCKLKESVHSSNQCIEEMVEEIKALDQKENSI